MTEHAFFVLTALLDGPLHGYAIMQTMVELSDGRVRGRVGTLYGVLDRLAAEGLIELDREIIVQGRTRRYYRLSEDGRNALARDAARQAANARTALNRLGPQSPGPLGAQA
jgi:DNA-binding PadR family transcriptional regulator